VDLASFSQQLDHLRGRALRAVHEAADPQSLDAVESSFLGRKGELRTLLGGIGQLPAEDRPRVGGLANPLREELEAAIAERRARLDEIAIDVRLARERTDVTLPGRPLPLPNRMSMLGKPVEAAQVQPLSVSGTAAICTPQMEDISAAITRLHVDPLGLASVTSVVAGFCVWPTGPAAPAHPPAMTAARTSNAERVGNFEGSLVRRRSERAEL